MFSTIIHLGMVLPVKVNYFGSGFESLLYRINFSISLSVYRVRHKITGEFFACKIVFKDDSMNDLQSMTTELEIMKRVKHPHVVSLYELFESPTCLWLILELVIGGDLRDHIATIQHYTEPIASHHMKQILDGLHYLHSRGDPGFFCSVPHSC